MINNNIMMSYLRKEVSTLLAFSAIALLTISSLPLSNFLLQPVQAQTVLTFKTPSPSTGTDDGVSNVTLTFQGHGTTTPDGSLNNVAGDYEITDPGTHGDIISGTFTNGSGKVSLGLDLSEANHENLFDLETSCGDSVTSTFRSQAPPVTVTGPVECSTSSSQGGGNSTSSPSQTTGTTPTTTTTTTKDGDSDGIPDSSDKCLHNSNHRCFKEGDTTTQQLQQQSSSSSSSSGNQTR